MAQESVQEYDEMVFLKDHMQIVKDLKDEYEKKLSQKDEIIKKLDGWGNGLQVKLNALTQQLYFLKNVYPDVENILKGQARWAPNSLKNAIMLIDFLWAQYKSVWLMYKRAHEKVRRPLWHWVALIAAITVCAVVISNPTAVGAGLERNAPFLLAFAIVALLALIVMRRRAEKKANTPQ